eukprot:TRINITY_DN5561_c0_g1_i1.p3 TRINITY_DN5561_c0_g1~~TRINITY_DN5561_c0_g1_i1.p3  ORF type:complete len:297 (-),score=67.38 TRINITY_DN5561_c0_g1_i1:2686-3468(-)
MSSYIDKLVAGDTLEIMGPIGSINFEIGKETTVNMVAGGSGITPIFQILQYILSNQNNNNDIEGGVKTKVNLIYANNEEKDILLKQQLDQLQSKYPDTLNVVHILKQNNNTKYESGFVTKEILKKYIDTRANTLVCGPKVMEEAILKNLLELSVPNDRVILFTKSQMNSTTTSTTTTDTDSIVYFSMEEVKKHNQDGDCWMVIKDKVYNVTKFVDDHPGGYIILDGAGKDSTVLFFDQFPHSEDAESQLSNFLIGHLKKS